MPLKQVAFWEILGFDYDGLLYPPSPKARMIVTGF
jgi:hypothetical protein